MFRPLSFALAATALGLPALASAEEIVFAWTPNPQTPQVDVALADNAFEAAGLEVNLVSFPSGREAFEALLGGQVDIAFMAEFPAATGALMDQDFVIIADLARYTGSRIIGNAEAGPLDSAADLEGRRIGTTLGTNVDYFLSGVLTDAGVEAEIINASPVDLVSALARGDVDAIVPFPTFYEAAKTALSDNYLELRAPGYQPHYILAATPEMAEARADELEVFLGALVGADAKVAADPDAAIAAVATSMQGSVPEEAIGTMWEDVDFGVELKSDLLELLVSESAWIVGQGVVNADAPSAETLRPYFAGAALKAVAPEAVDLP
jgi:NitT/TauT family transport system substrate-binding protein